MKLEGLQVGTEQVPAQRVGVTVSPSLERGVRAMVRAGRRFLTLRAALMAGGAEERSGPVGEREKPVGWSGPVVGGHRTADSLDAAFGNLPFVITEPTADRRDAVIREFSAGAERIFGYERRDVLGKSASILYLHEDAERFPRWLEELKAGETWEEVELFRSDGTTFPAILAAFPFEMPGTGETLTLGVTIDLTDRHRGKKRVGQIGNDHRKIIGLIPDIIFRINSAGEFLDVISSSDEKLYLSREAIIGKKIEEIFPEKEVRLFSGCIRRAFEKGTLQTIEYPLEVKTGTLHFEARVIPSDDREVMVLSRDVTREKEARLARQKEEKMEGLSILAGGVAHDFNNLLTVILGNANLGMMEARQGSELYSSLEAIEKASLEAAGLCKKMLAYAGKTRVEFNEINVNGVIGHMHELLRRSVAEDIALHVQLGDDVPPVMSEASQVEQVVMSLVINAAEAVDDKSGEIRISTGRTRIGRAVLKTMAFDSELPTGEAVLIEVSDNGAGMSPDIQERMFDPFFTTKFTGRGLGLSEVQGMVAMHKGGCQVASEPGVGTTVRIFLPALAKPECAAAEKPDESGENRVRKGTVLVVDDEAGMRRITKSMLEVWGYSVMTAGSGGEAIEEYRQHHAGISTVLLDMAMPDMNGTQVLGELRKIEAGVPVLMMSGFSKPEAFGGSGDGEPDGFLQKPFSLEGLKDALRHVTEDREAAAAKR